MFFTITYRDKSGTLTEETIDAANRSECVAECRRRGITPKSIHEGAAARHRNVSAVSARHTNEGKHSRGSSLALRLMTFGVLLAVGLCCAWFYLGNEAHESRTQTREHKKASLEKPRNISEPQKQQVSTGSHTPRSMHQKEKPVKAASTNAITASDHADGTNSVDTTPPVFENPSDQIFAMLPPADGRASAPPPPIGPDIERQFLESLKHEMKILDTDAPDVKAMKQSVIDARADMKALIDGGMSVSEVVKEHRKLAAENASIRNEVMSELKKVIDSGDSEAALAYRKRINAALQEMGIAPLTLPVTDGERAERARQRRENRRKRLQSATPEQP